MAYAPASFLNLWLDITITATKGIGFLSDVSVTCDGDIMTVNGFAMRIITQCTALHYVIILSTGILLYTAHPLSYRLTGFFVATILVIFINALRLIITGVVGSISWDAFVIMHDYLWIAGFSLLVLGIWFVWADRRFIITVKTFRRGSLVLFTCTVVYGVLLLAMPFYGKVMAQAASPLFKTLISDPEATIIFDGQQMLYEYAAGNFSATFATDLMAVALFIGLFLSGGDYGKVAVKRALLGILIIITVCVIAIAGGGTLAVNAGHELAIVFLWTEHGLLLLLAIIWGVLSRVRHQSAVEN